MTVSMHRRPARRSLVAVLAAATLALTACGSDEPEASDTPSPGGSAALSPSAGTEGSPAASATPEPVPPPVPEVASCHQLTWDQALAPTASPEGSDCSRSTSLTFHVGTLGKGKDGQPLQVDSDEAQARIARACPRELRSFLGGTRDQRRLTLLTTVWFTPTLEEEAQGARWYRCDLVAPTSEQRLMRVGRGMRNVLGTDKARRYALCATGKPGSATFTHVPCGRKHSWRALSTVDIPGEKHPGRAAVAQLMEQPCTDAATEVAEDKRNVRWGQEGPTRTQWRAGQRYGVCWVPA